MTDPTPPLDDPAVAAAVGVGGPGALVLVRWRAEWFMGEVVAQSRPPDDDAHDQQDEDAGASVDADPDAPRRRVLVHVHGEPETRDRWHDAASPQLVGLGVRAEPDAAIGVFPSVGDVVELLVAPPGAPVLVGRVSRVLPRRDASMIEVPDPHCETSAPWRLCIGNGFLRIRTPAASERHVSAELHPDEQRGRDGASSEANDDDDDDDDDRRRGA